MRSTQNCEENCDHPNCDLGRPFEGLSILLILSVTSAIFAAWLPKYDRYSVVGSHPVLHTA